MYKLFSKFTKTNILKKIWRKFLSLFYIEQWGLLIGKPQEEHHWDDFQLFSPPIDRFWADPFPWFYNNKYYIFYEELLFKTEKGYICCFTLDENMTATNHQVVLDQPYHLSYPFIFEHNQKIYMMPETKENQTIEIYECKHFPNEWKLYKTIMHGVSAVDSTLLEHEGKWWLFTNITTGNEKAYDNLYLFFAESPFSDNWTPHPLNPIIKDIQSARPAGKIYKEGNTLIRPSQDCSIRYGYAINLNKIIKLSETEYSETLQKKIIPPKDNPNMLSTHTWNSIEGIRTIDAEFRRKKTES